MTRTLDGLIEGFEADCLALDKSIPNDTIVDLCSGGVQKKGGEPPMLCLDSDDAMRFWRMAAAEYAEGLPKGSRFKWIERPTLDRWQITMTDKHVTHRMTSHRFNVFARIAVK